MVRICPVERGVARRLVVRIYRVLEIFFHFPTPGVRYRRHFYENSDFICGFLSITYMLIEDSHFTRFSDEFCHLKSEGLNLNETVLKLEQLCHFNGNEHSVNVNGNNLRIVFLYSCSDLSTIGTVGNIVRLHKRTAPPCNRMLPSASHNSTDDVQCAFDRLYLLRPQCSRIEGQ